MNDQHWANFILVCYSCRFVKSKYSFAETAEREPPPKGAGVTMLLYGTKVSSGAVIPEPKHSYK